MALYSHLDQFGAGRVCVMMEKEGREAWPPRVTEGKNRKKENRIDSPVIAIHLPLPTRD